LIASKAVTATPLQSDGMLLINLDSNMVRLQQSSDRGLVLYSLCLLRKHACKAGRAYQHLEASRM